MAEIESGAGNEPERPPAPKSLILKRIWKRLWLHNQNYICVVTGKTGSGKSYAALSLCEKLDPNFDISRVVFSAKEFMTLINSEEIRKGSAILWDESGVGLNSRDFQSVSNKALNYFLQSFRCMNLALILTLPSLSMLDIVGRRLAHQYLETERIDRKKGKAALKIFDLQANPLTGKLYTHYPRSRPGGKGIVTIKRVWISKPSIKLTHRYESKRTQWLNALAANTLNTISGLEKAEEEDSLDKKGEIAKIVNEALERKAEFVTMKAGKPYCKIEDLQLAFGVGKPKAALLKRALEKSLDTYNKPNTD